MENARLLRTQRRAFSFKETIPMNNGWIRLHRSSLNNPMFRRDKTAWLIFITLLLMVDKHSGKWSGGRFQLAIIMELKPTTIYQALQRLEKSKMVTLSSNNKYTTISICNWSKYQYLSDNADDNKMTTNRQQNDTLTRNTEYTELQKGAEFQTFFKQPNPKSKHQTKAKEIAQIFTDKRGGSYFNGLHLNDIAILITNHGYDRVKEIAEFGLNLPKADYNPWIDKPIDIADHWARLVELHDNGPDIGRSGERQQLINSLREAGFKDKTISANLIKQGFKPLEET